MKKAALALVLTVAGLASTTALAQANFVLRANVPFAFAIDGRLYSAGQYSLQAKNSNGVILRNQKTGESAIVPLINPRDNNGRAPQLVFAVHGSRATLVTLTDAEGHTWRVPASPKNHEENRNTQPMLVAVALK